MKKRILIISLLLTVFIACQQKANTNAVQVTIENNLEAYVLQCWNNKNPECLKKIANPNLTRILNGIKVASSVNEMHSHILVYVAAFPDMKVELDKVTVSNHQAFIQWTFTGTNSGEYNETPPTNKKVTVKGSSLLYFDANELLYKEEVFYNELDFLQQLGYTISPPQTEE